MSVGFSGVVASIIIQIIKYTLLKAVNLKLSSYQMVHLQFKCYMLSPKMSLQAMSSSMFTGSVYTIIPSGNSL